MTNYEVRSASWKKNGGDTVFTFDGITAFIQYAKVRVAIDKSMVVKYCEETDTIYLEE